MNNFTFITILDNSNNETIIVPNKDINTYNIDDFDYQLALSSIMGHTDFTYMLSTALNFISGTAFINLYNK